MGHGIASISGLEMDSYFKGRFQSHPPTNYQHYSQPFVCQEKTGKGIGFWARAQSPEHHEHPADQW
jgi:hypothetical protein